MRGGVLELCERGVGLKRLAKRRRASIADVIVVETANERTKTVSLGIDDGDERTRRRT